MNILFIGYLKSKEYCLNNKYASIAGNMMQFNIVSKLINSINNNVEIVSVSPTAPFPRVKKVIFIRKKEIIENDINIVSLFFINIPIIKQLTQLFSVLFETIKWVISFKKKPKLILLFNYNPVISFPALLMMPFKNTKVVCFVADPIIDLSGRKGMKHLIWVSYQRFSDYLLKKFSGVIVVNENIIEDFDIHCPYIIMEGGVEKSENVPISRSINKNFIFHFSGALYQYNGVELIIRSFMHLEKENLELHIFGSGPLESFVTEQSKVDERIKFFGLKDNSVVLKYQRESDFLLNIRLDFKNISKYSFPSKLIEYMNSGIPVISTRFPGLRTDYLNHLIILEDASIKGLSDLFDEAIAFGKGHYLNYGLNARKFIQENKNWEHQINRMSQFLEDIILQ